MASHRKHILIAGTRTARDIVHHCHPDTTRPNISVFNLCITTKTKFTADVAVDHEMSLVHSKKKVLIQVSLLENPE